MSRASFKHRPKARPPGGPPLLRRLLLTAASSLLAAALASTAFAQNQPDVKGKLPSQTPPQGGPRQPARLTLAARPDSVTLCPGKPAQVRLFLSGAGAGSFEYHWRADGGDLKADGAEAFWDLSGVKPGAYTAAVTVTFKSLIAASQSLTRQARVVVSACPEAPQSCPEIRLSCPRSVAEGEAAILTAEVSGGGQPRGKVSYLWSVSPDAPAARDGHAIKVDTKGLGGRSLFGTFEVTGYGLTCAERCRTLVAQASTPTTTHSPTASPTPSPIPSPSPAPPVGGLSPTPPATPRPGASPAPPAGPSPSAPATPAADSGFWRGITQSSWAAALLILAVLALLSLVAYAAYKLSGGALRKGRARGGGLPRGGNIPGDGKGAGGDAGEIDEAGTGEGVEGAFVGGGTDELHCTVYAPFGAAPGEGFLVQAFAHLAADAARLAGLAREAQQEAERRGSRSLGEVARGQELGFHLLMPGLEVDEPSQSIVWRGGIETVQFGVNVPQDFRPRAVSCKLTVTSGTVPLGHIRFTFNVAEAAAPAPAPLAPPLARHRDFVRYRQAFISYASEDRAEVLRCVQMLTLLKIKCFQDVLSLEPGQRWERGIYRNIDVSDVLFLFWSSAASKSAWVEKEVRYALGLKAGDDQHPPEIVPVILQGPPEVPPPGYLPELHFNDPFAYFIRAEAAMRRAASEG